MWGNLGYVRGTLHQEPPCPQAPGSTPVHQGFGERCLFFTQRQPVTLWHRRVGRGDRPSRPGQASSRHSCPALGVSQEAPGVQRRGQATSLRPAALSRAGGQVARLVHRSPRKAACPPRRSPGGGQWAACSPSSSLLPRLCVLCLFLPSLLKPHGFPGSFQALLSPSAPPLKANVLWP